MSYTPRHMRKGYQNKSGDSGAEKKRQFRRAKAISDRFIHQPYKILTGRLASSYARYCDATRAGTGFKA